MKIARNVAVSHRHVEWYAPLPAPSLRELARPKGVTEGVSFVGSSMPMDYEPAHIGSEIFYRLRSSKYTPSVSLSLDSSLREGAGDGLCHSTGYSETPTLRAIFIAPTEGLHHSTGCSLNSGVTGDFHRPYGGAGTVHWGKAGPVRMHRPRWVCQGGMKLLWFTWPRRRSGSGFRR